MKCFLALVFLSFVVFVSAAPLAEQDEKPPLILRSKQRRWLADDLREYHRQMRNVHKNYIPSYPDALSLTNLTIGTPPVAYLVALETGTESVFVLGKDYAGRSAEQRFYDPALSSTSRPAGNYTSFTGDVEVYGPAFVDLFEVFGNMAYNNTPQRFGVVNDVYDPYTLEPAMPEGVLGLSWNPADAADPNENSSFVVNLFAKIGGPRFWSHFLQVFRDEDNGSRHIIGLTEFGGSLTEMCARATPENTLPLFWLPESRSLAFFVDAFTYNGKQHNSGLAKVDTGVPNILLLFDAFLAIYEDVQPTYDYDHFLYTVDCSKAGNLPDWTFTIGGSNYTIPSTDYVVDLQLPDGQCALSAFVDDSETTDFVLGFVFHNRWCIKMDIDNQAISIMDVLPQ